MVISQPQEETDPSLTFPFTAEPVNHRVQGTEGQADQKGQKTELGNVH